MNLANAVILLVTLTIGFEYCAPEKSVPLIIMSIRARSSSTSSEESLEEPAPEQLAEGNTENDDAETHAGQQGGEVATELIDPTEESGNEPAPESIAGGNTDDDDPETLAGQQGGEVATEPVVPTDTSGNEPAPDPEAETDDDDPEHETTGLQGSEPATEPIVPTDSKPEPLGLVDDATPEPTASITAEEPAAGAEVDNPGGQPSGNLGIEPTAAESEAVNPTVSNEPSNEHAVDESTAEATSPISDVTTAAVANGDSVVATTVPNAAETQTSSLVEESTAKTTVSGEAGETTAETTEPGPAEEFTTKPTAPAVLPGESTTVPTPPIVVENTPAKPTGIYGIAYSTAGPPTFKLPSEPEATTEYIAEEDNAVKCVVMAKNENYAYQTNYVSPCPYDEDNLPTNEGIVPTLTITAFYGLDDNWDTLIDADEWDGDGFELLLQEHDENNDGKISKTEFSNVKVFIKVW